jgi:DUF1365 family protein
LIPVDRDAGPAGAAGAPGAGAVIEQHCRKGFYVSPFMDMDMNYTFRVAVPDQRVMVAIRAADNDGLLLAAALTGERITLTDAALLRALATHPLLTLKVVGAIHWHALRLMLKGLKLRPRPVPPAAPITVVNSEGWPP